MSVKRTKLQDRYELREILCRGGMGVVYKAYDRLMNREVALKTILDIDKSENLALFYKEWSTLVTMVHPHVINIYDIGEFEQDGADQTVFRDAAAAGVTLDKLIKEGSPRLERQGSHRYHRTGLPRPARRAQTRFDPSRCEAEQHLRYGRWLGQNHRLRNRALGFG